MKTNVQCLSCLTHFFLEWELFQTKVLEKIQKHILCWVTFFLFENLSRKSSFHKNRTRITVTLHEDQCTMFIMSHSFLLRMRIVSDKRFRENPNTHFVLSNFFFLFENLSRKFSFHKNLTRITVTLHEDQCTMFIISHSLLLRMRIVSDKSCRENPNTHLVVTFFFSKIMPFIRQYGKIS